ncbi:MAG: hypothetical protein V1782_10630 [Pseudomonadota bacterium]
MKKILFVFIFFVGLSDIATAGQYDGIWTDNDQDVDYFVITQRDDGQIIILDEFPDSSGLFVGVAYMGTISGNVMSVSSLYPTLVDVEVTVTMTSSTTGY